jgi:hypothetical protein
MAAAAAAMSSAALGFLAGCGAAPLVATVTPSTQMSVAATVALTPPAAATSVSAEFGPTTAYGRSTPPIAVAAGGGGVRFPILGLPPGATSHVRVHATAGGVSVGDSVDLTVTTAALPADFPDFEKNVDAGGTDGYFLVSVADNLMQTAYAVAIDRSGRAAWYRPIRAPSRRAYDFRRLPDGHFTFFQGDADSFEETDALGQTVRTWTDAAAPLGADGHDIVLLPGGGALLIGVDSHVEDTTALDPLGKKDAKVLDARIDEVDAGGKPVASWKSWPAVGLDEATTQYSLLLDPDKNVDSPHANALAATPDGNALMSFYFTDSIVKVDRKRGAIAWRLGGKKSDFRIVGDPLGGFDNQHDAHFLPSGNLLVFDNGTSHTPQQSRVVEYRIDEAARTATFVWEYRHPHVVSIAGGSATRLDNGHTVIGWPVASLVSEVDAAGTLLWEYQCDWVRLYRAVYEPTIYPPTALPGG